MLHFLLWILATILIVVGGVWLYFNVKNRPMLQAEVDLMKKTPELPGEEYWVHNFRVSRSEGEYNDNLRGRPIAIWSLVIGAIILLLLLAEII